MTHGLCWAGIAGTACVCIQEMSACYVFPSVPDAWSVRVDLGAFSPTGLELIFLDIGQTGLSHSDTFGLRAPSGCLPCSPFLSPTPASLGISWVGTQCEEEMEQPGTGNGEMIRKLLLLWIQLSATKMVCSLIPPWSRPDLNHWSGLCCYHCTKNIAPGLY